MWTITADSGSLLSVVKFDAKKAPAMAKEAGVDPDSDAVYLLVRARIKQSAEYLADVLDAINNGEVEGWKKPVVKEDKSADYQFRMVVTLDQWKQFLCFEAEGITFDSHFKENLRDRAPEGTNKAGIYSAAMTTWTAWSKLQPNPPYGGLGYGSYGSKPDCRNCGHKEIKHTIKGDRCNFGWKFGKWDPVTKTSQYEPDPAVADGPCACTKYEAKYPDCTECKHPEPEHENLKHADGTHDEHCRREGCACKRYTQIVPAPPLPVKSAQASAAVFSGTDTGVSQTYPASVYGSSWDTEPDESDLSDWAQAEDGYWHPAWCAIFDGDKCICAADEVKEGDEDYYTGPITVTQPAVPPVENFGEGGVVNGVFQEFPVRGETPAQKKARVKRNKRARRRARQQAAAQAKEGQA